MFPFESLSGENRELGLVVAVLIGFCFGFVLERAGFGKAPKLAAQFYLTDMTVLKVMFGAIVTAMLGLIVLSGLGLADYEAITTSAASTTFIWPMLVGGLLLGVGFIVSGYCPGTSLVSTASGNIDGLVTFSGVIIGSVVFSEAYPLLSGFYASGNEGQLFLPDLLGLPPAVVAIGVTLMAVGMFIGAEKVERIMAARAKGGPTDVEPAAPRRFVFATFALGALAGLAVLVVPVGATTAAAAADDRARALDSETLAHRVLEAPWTLRIIDLRTEDAFTASRVPGSANASIETLGELGLAYSEGRQDLVLLGAQDLAETPEAALAYPGRIFVLTGGFAAWREFALDPPPAPPEGATLAELDSFRFRAAVHSRLTGVAAPPPPKPTKFVAPPKRKGGGCDG